MNPVEFECRCPACKDRLTHASAVGTDQDIMPKEGDITICATCLTLLEFDADLKPLLIDIKTLEPEVQDLIVLAICNLSQNRPTLH